ncbi:BglII/BstYI family type II restriction endonuclease [Niabella yanshanensis]|uniref:BglII/BstYI family type II restriction endonuclease n=1 Tax=Niabella yanshanensis TaxID=577386 RepID=A0ABZ0W7E2_9BACT|nr:BglII/BstYI family type II restriction endonuclease [Niabella yanshanensis]WQD39061.1 BglII/BstYI family type II restriction endonuclease [Niabella yanshanensis]
MSNYYKNERVLNIPGYEVYFTRFADSIIKDHFNDATTELTAILNHFSIREDQIIQGGGGLSSITQSLGGLLVQNAWTKTKIESEHHVRGRVLTSESHEVDHYKSFQQGNIGLEIEWNNKDPFYDRDLENFRKLHQIGELSIGIIITRGASLQKELYNVIRRFLEGIYPFTLPQLNSRISLSDTAKKNIGNHLDLPKDALLDKIASTIYYSKYGAATTHMDKLLLRLNRGVGNPCPFILIGIGSDRLTV